MCPPSCLSAHLYSSHLSYCLNEEDLLINKYWRSYFLLHFPHGSTEKMVFWVNAKANKWHPFSVNVIQFLWGWRNRWSPWRSFTCFLHAGWSAAVLELHSQEKCRKFKLRFSQLQGDTKKGLHVVGVFCLVLFVLFKKTTLLMNNKQSNHYIF